MESGRFVPKDVSYKKKDVSYNYKKDVSYQKKTFRTIGTKRLGAIRTKNKSLYETSFFVRKDLYENTSIKYY